jgi:hypothetical protein
VAEAAEEVTPLLVDTEVGAHGVGERWPARPALLDHLLQM